METKVIQKPATNITVYVASDGKEFSYESSCLSHERDLAFDKAKNALSVVNFSGHNTYTFDGFWYKCEKEEDYKLLYDYYNRTCTVYRSILIEYPAWVKVDIEYSENSSDACTFTVFGELKDDYDDLKEMLRDESI